MEMDQVEKQLTWLDEERRRDKNLLGSLDERVEGLEKSFATLAVDIRELTGEFTRLNTLFTRMDSQDEFLQQTRLEAKKQFEEWEKQVKKKEEETENLRRSEMRSLESNLTEVHKDLEQIAELKRSMQARIEGETRLGRQIDELRNQFEVVRRNEEEYTRTIRLMDDGRRQDSKRLIDLNGEVAAIRKRVDEHRGKLELATANLKKIDTRIGEMGILESERQESLSSFLESQSYREAERDKMWKEWQTRFNTIGQQAADVEGMLEKLDNTQRSVSRSQQVLDELNQKVERRINEITEIQRLGEERFRQEWVTFKADDQKRWTNYTLTMEEQRNETQRQRERLADRVTQLEDNIQEIQDLVQQTNEHAEKRLKTLLSMYHEWVSSFERVVGRSR